MHICLTSSLYRIVKPYTFDAADSIVSRLQLSQILYLRQFLRYSRQPIIVDLDLAKSFAVGDFRWERFVV